MRTITMRLVVMLLAVALMCFAMAQITKKKANAWGIAAIVAAVVPASATHASAPAAAAAGGGVAAGTVATGVGIGVLAGAVVWCGFNQPKRNWRRDTWVDGRHDVIPSYKPRKYGCIVKKKSYRDPPIATRG